MKSASIIRNFIVENFLFEEDENLKSDTSFLENNIINSVGMLELVLFLEENFGFTVEDEELIPENLDSIVNAANYVQKKRGAQR